MDTVVETRWGRLRGDERGGVVVFRGIPYARPPVGSRRFRPPERPAAWAGVRDATAPGPSAPQLSVGNGRILPLLGPGSRCDEDCLYLNVWTPALDRARRPVMVWIHGGAFLLGSGSSPLYSGRALARRGDVVVVSIHYRLGALGFLPIFRLLPEGPFASNPGVRDQIAALEWVRENVSAFGGDPENVTIFGESAGGMSVATLLASPRARGLFHRAIAQSGAGHHCSGPDRAAVVAGAFLEELGLAPHSAEKLLTLPVRDLLSAQTRTSLRLGFASGDLPWQPAVDGDVLPQAPVEAAARGASAPVPLLIGSNRDEWRLFMLGDRAAHRMSEAGLRRRFARTLPGHDAEGVAHADQALRIYGSAGGERGGGAPAERWCAFQTDRVFGYPAARLAELHASRGASTYAYLLTAAPRLLSRRVGACHGIELPLLFGTWRHPAFRLLFAGSRPAALARTLQRTWARFAWTGRPGEESLPEWPTYDPLRRRSLVLGEEPVLEEAPREEQRLFWASRDVWDTRRHEAPAPSRAGQSQSGCASPRSSRRSWPRPRPRGDLR